MLTATRKASEKSGVFYILKISRREITIPKNNRYERKKSKFLKLHIEFYRFYYFIPFLSLSNDGSFNNLISFKAKFAIAVAPFSHRCVSSAFPLG